jgi:GNAT superfamily N-acetyltransferase
MSHSVTPSAPVIRPATPDDVPILLTLIRELAAYQKHPDDVVATEELIHEALFGAEHPFVYAVVAEHEGEVVGFALYFFNFSTWLGRPGLYLEDLYVRPTMRGRGIGKALLLHLARLAVQKGCGRMEWSVLDWNASAIAFYKSLGAEPQDDATIYRLSGEALAQCGGAL